MVNTMLSNLGLSEVFIWGDAILTTCYILNRVPNKRNKITPYEIWCNNPNLNYLKVWGCRAIVKLTELKRKTIGKKGIDYIFIGYAEHRKAYSFYVIQSNDFVSIHVVIQSRDATFDETQFSSVPRLGHDTKY